MKLRFLHLILPCLFLLLPGISGTANSQSVAAITEDKVLDIINSMDRASRKGTIAGMIGPLARDVKIKMTVTAPNSAQEQVLTLTKDQYAMLTRRVMRRRIAYQVARKNTRVKVYEGGDTAMVTSDLYETLTMPEGTLHAVSSEVTVLSIRSGKILITSLESRTRIY